MAVIPQTYVITVSELLHGVLRASAATRTRRRASVEPPRRSPGDPDLRAGSGGSTPTSGRSSPTGRADRRPRSLDRRDGMRLATGNRAHFFERVPGRRLVASPG
jgi:hypothetical protein